MGIFQAFILGLVEGLTEFLPVSSTAHLIITSRFLHISQSEFQTFFEVFIQSGAILAVVLVYFQYMLRRTDLMKKVAISFIPTAIVGVMLHKMIKTVFFESYYLIIASLFFVGLLFLILEVLIKQKKVILKKSVDSLSVADAVYIGLMQSIAIIPGVSRAGIVMLAMMGKGYRRDESAVYSFLLAVPTIIAASVFDLIKTDFRIISDPENLKSLVIGFFVSLITAYLSIKWLIAFLKDHSLSIFGFYRMALSLFLYVL